MLQDIGGEDRPISDRLLSRLQYVCPNRTELERLANMPVQTRAEVCTLGMASKPQKIRPLPPPPPPPLPPARL